MLPENLRGKLILYFFLLILITNGLFAIVGYSRENIHTREEIFGIAKFVGRTIMPSATEFLKTGSDEELNDIYRYRSGLAKELLITIYDKNWWKKWGDEVSLPPEGFPQIQSMNKVVSRPGIAGKTSRELYYQISDNGQNLGAVGIGIPLVNNLKGYNPAFDFFILLLIDCILGISVATIVSSFTIKPLETLMEGIEAIREGNYAMRVTVKGNGELAKLSEVFNKMASTVQATIKENFNRNLILDEKLQELWEIYELTRSMSLSLELRNILEAFLDKAITLSFSSYGQVILRHHITKKLIIIAESEFRANISVDEFEKGLNRCFLESKPIEYEASDHLLLFIPLVSANQVQGVLFLSKKDSNEYSANIKHFLETISPIAASMVSNSKLYTQVAELNEYMVNILDSVNTGVVTLNRQNKFAIANKVFREMFNVISSKIENHSFVNFCELLPDNTFAGKIKEYVHRFDIDSIDNSTKNKEIFSYVSIEKKKQLIQVRIIPLKSGNKVIGKIIVFEDVTEAKRIEKQVVESEKWAVLGKLAASVAHEIRNPLVAIRSLVEILGDEAEGESKEHVDVILGEVLRLNKVVSELLSLARPEVTQRSKTDINTVINEIELLVKHEAQKNSISIVKVFDNERCIINIDSEKIKQALLNIILNSIQAIGKKGSIEISVSNDSEQVIIAIKNDGPVIDPNTIDNIFTPFFTTKATGTGLGLAITKKIVELHNGKIEVESSAKIGTIFKFIFPLEDEANDEI